MKRWFATTFIAVYLAILSGGLACHAIGFAVTSHPLMYFIVWDMFCGWCAYTTQIHVIGEGESMRYYELAPGPWGAMRPWGPMPRHNYDFLNNHQGRIAVNTLRHTVHEPITRIFIVEESWCKKYDLPDPVWKMRYGDEERKINRYCHLRAELAPDGTYARTYPAWVLSETNRALEANPRLHQEAQRTRPMVLYETERPGMQMPAPASPEMQAQLGIGSTLGN